MILLSRHAQPSTDRPRCQPEIFFYFAEVFSCLIPFHPVSIAHRQRENKPTKTMKTKPVKINSYKNETTYRIGKWLVTVERKSEKTYCCGSSKSSSWSQWSAINMENPQVSENKSGMGGIKQAVEKLG